MLESPLVSIFVLTYNSAEYVVDTLESIKKQTYINIELCVSDDCSQDNTVDVCREWISNNKDRFVRTEVLTVPLNTGVSANFNRGYKWCHGLWIKGIAGDDQLTSKCIESNMAYVNNHQTADVIFSDQFLFNEFGDLYIKHYNKYFDALSAKEFKILLLYYNFLPTPTSFIRKKVLDEVGGANELIPLLEDKPLWVQLSLRGYEMHYNRDVTVKYRVSSTSISQGRNKKINRKYQESRKLADKGFLKYMNEISFLYGIYGKCRYKNQYESNCFSRFKYLLCVFNPYFWYIKYLFFKVNCRA